ncbi:MAG TPA: ATP-binding protein, partial [Thermoanaerobacterales bacterium]|nr:ATP-binding protein [Thermoanaerobacterales bacterium]
MNNIRQRIFDAQMAAKSLLIYRNILNDSIVKKFVQILERTLRETPDPVLISDYHEFFSSLVIQSETYKGPTVGNLWKDHILNLVLVDENPFSLKCEKAGIDGVSQPLIKLTQRDLTSLQTLHDFNFSAFISFMRQKFGEAFTDVPVMYTIESEALFPYPESYFKQKHNTKILMNNSLDWNQNINVLA